MTYRNTYDPNKNYTQVRVNHGQKLVSNEINELQSISGKNLSDSMNTLFDEGFIFSGFEFIQDVDSILTLGPGSIQIDGFPRDIFSLSNLDYTDIEDEVFDIYATVVYRLVTKSEDTDIEHPTSPGLPIGDREKAEVILSIEDPEEMDLGNNVLRIKKVKILEYNPSTRVLTVISTNTGGFIQLSRIPGQLSTEQIGPGTIDSNEIKILIDDLPLRDAIAVRTDDAEGSFLAVGGNVTYEDNIIVGDEIGVEVQIDSFRAYVSGFQVSSKEARTYIIDHSDSTKNRLNESKTYSTGTLDYNLTKNPASTILSLDGDVAVVSQNITRGAGNFDTLINTPVVSITSVVQGETTYEVDTDFQLSGDQVEWLSDGDRPTQGTTYQVSYVYRRDFVIGSDVVLNTSRKQLTFTGGILPVNGSSFQVSYTYFLSRIDSIFVSGNGQISVLKGIPDDLPKSPLIPDGVLEMCRISLPPATHLGNTFLSSNGYESVGISSINIVDVQIPATKMKDHKKRNETLTNIAFNDTINSSINYLVTRDPTVAKVGTFADSFYDDRLSDYGQPDQNIVFNTERGVGEGSKESFSTGLTVAGSLPSQLRQNKGFLTLNYSETVTLDQNKWSDIVDLQPYMSDVETRLIEVPNKNLNRNQKFNIYGHNWPVGEESVEFFFNGVKLTGINILLGSAGSQTNSVTANANRKFIVQCTVPTNAPIGSRTITAKSFVTGKFAEVIVGVQTAAVALPPPRTTTVVNTKCNETRHVLNHRIASQRALLIKKHPVLGEIQRFNCGTGQWDFVSYWDPIVQTFIVSEDQFITATDLYFTSRDTQSDIFVSIIQTENGIPNTSQPRIGTAVVNSSSVVTNGGPTKVTFDNPVFVKAGVPYGLFVECPTTGYSIQFARLGKLDRSSYESVPRGFRRLASKTNNPIGPLPASPLNNRRTHSTLYGWQSKTYTFTPLETITLYQIICNVYIGPDALSNEALAQFEIRDVLSNEIVWSTSRVLNQETNPTTGRFTANEFKNLVGSRGLGEIIPSAIALVANRQYQFRVSANTGYAYPYIRDNYQDDGIANVELLGFTPSTVTYDTIKENALTSGQLFFSPDGIVWQGYPDSDLRFKLYSANFNSDTDYNVTFNKMSTDPEGEEVDMLDSATHFTSLLSAVTPEGTSISMEYSVDNGATWLPHVPVVFKEEPKTDDAVDRETWAFYNYGFFNEQRFRENQFDFKFLPSNPNKAITLPTLTSEINFRMKVRSNNAKLSPVVDAGNWSIRFDKNGLTTTYFSRTQTTNSNVDSAKVYVWAVIPSGVTMEVSLTLEGEDLDPTYVTKSSASATRVVDSALNIIEYRYDFSSGDLTSQSPKNKPKVLVEFETTSRFIQPELHFVGFNTF